MSVNRIVFWRYDKLAATALFEGLESIGATYTMKKDEGWRTVQTRERTWRGWGPFRLPLLGWTTRRERGMVWTFETTQEVALALPRWAE